MTPAIRIENLGKCYRVNHAEQRLPYKTLRDTLARIATVPVRRWKSGGHDGVVEQFWALRDVSFDVQIGEVLGIIGRNGAGKSTLLKILSRITVPTTGLVEIRGRVGSLLEVGTGFHPELTGRENIFMNGSILGMKRTEIRQKFDEIVDFSGVEKFLDTPVKRYSSGMQVRLAFAVAAHVEPEIMIVDEVLAVGDIAFQQKCIDRMGEVGKRGCTVLLVSHNMPAIEALCRSAILLDAGGVLSQGKVSDVIHEYRLRAIATDSQSSLDGLRTRVGRQIFRSANLIDERGMATQFVSLSAPFQLRLGLDVEGEIEYPVIGIGIDDSFGQRMLTVYTPLSMCAIDRLAGRCEVECQIPNLPLGPGEYTVKLAIVAAGCELDSVERALQFTVVDGDAFGEGRGFHRGVCIAPSFWKLTGRCQARIQEPLP